MTGPGAGDLAPPEVDRGARTSLSAARRARVRREWPFALVFVIATAGVLFALVRSEHWLRGIILVAGAMMLAAALRAVLRDSRAGMLAVRSRSFDMLCYLALAAGIVVIGVLLPR